ncbi:hypothetical protein CL630_01785 [bacterium]|nr:hypothetical protein [bacterium]|tara:strand:- start:16997 stop:17254 length:258 start_codon:yes stop_codon:yes gene_type:complete
MKTKNLSITLPTTMLKIVDRASKKEHRTRSEFIREAIRLYMGKSLHATTTSAEEARALKQGRAEYARGEFITLENLFNEVDNSHR